MFKNYLQLALEEFKIWAMVLNPAWIPHSYQPMMSKHQPSTLHYFKTLTHYEVWKDMSILPPLIFSFMGSSML